VRPRPSFKQGKHRRIIIYPELIQHAPIHFLCPCVESRTRRLRIARACAQWQTIVGVSELVCADPFGAGPVGGTNARARVRAPSISGHCLLNCTVVEKLYLYFIGQINDRDKHGFGASARAACETVTRFVDRRRFVSNRSRDRYTRRCQTVRSGEIERNRPVVSISPNCSRSLRSVSGHENAEFAA
jgi:hypothetical protein